MLDEKDLQAIAKLISDSEARTSEKISALDQKVELVVQNSEKMLLDEIERMHNNTNAKIDHLQKNLEELQQYYRITKLENDNTALLLKMIEELSKRVEELEKKTA